MQFGDIKAILILLTSIFLFINTNKKAINPESKNIDMMRKNGAESTLFLKKNDIFPLKKRGKLLLVGSGARNTIKGGWGSGNVESQFIRTCEQGLEDAGFKIVSKDWLSKYPILKAKKHKDFVKIINAEAEEIQGNITYISFGAIQPEPDYDLPLDHVADTAIYVLSRMSGEGSDRRNDEGDLYLSRTEINNIQFLNNKFRQFLLVLNTCGVVDLTPILSVNNILYLSQLGIVTGDVLADIITGKVNPSGKLTATWINANFYEFFQDFGDIDNTQYKEGLYFGYRYFDTVDYGRPYFSFGFGKSYTDFNIIKCSLTNINGEITIKVKVKNIGKYKGKEVVQVYVSPSQNNIDKPYQSLVAFKKTKLLRVKASEFLTLKFKLEDVARYDEKTASYVLDNGKYIIRVGNSSDKTKIYGYIFLKDDVVIKKVKNIGGNKPSFKDFVPKNKLQEDNLKDIQKIILSKNDFNTTKVIYDYNFSINEKVKDLPDNELGKICLGKHSEDANSFYIPKVFGEAGETVPMKKEPHKFLVLADGPAGIRIVKKYSVDQNGPYRLCENPIKDRLVDYLPPEIFSTFDTLKNNKFRRGEVHYQNATAIPIATALAQTYNEKLVEEYAEIIAEDMTKFNIHLWLAPGVNIQRNIACGRNFEYFSEDPFLSGKMGAAMIRGVQKTKNKGATIKHFACNNQERNRLNSNSILSERVLREIYLKPFEIAIRESNPYAVMTSYNLINGEHSSQRRDLLIDVLRSEWGFKGLIMSDWFRSGRVPVKLSKHKAQFAVDNIIGGNNLQMPGHYHDYELVMEAVKNGTITRNHLLECASYVYDAIEFLNK